MLFSTMAHELYHVYQLKQIDAEIGDVCFFGHYQNENESFIESAFGWVYAYTDKDVDETIPTIISIVVSILFSVFYVFVMM